MSFIINKKKLINNQVLVLCIKKRNWNKTDTVGHIHKSRSANRSIDIEFWMQGERSPWDSAQLNLKTEHRRPPPHTPLTLRSPRKVSILSLGICKIIHFVKILCNTRLIIKTHICLNTMRALLTEARQNWLNSNNIESIFINVHLPCASRRTFITIWVVGLPVCLLHNK